MSPLTALSQQIALDDRTHRDVESKFLGTLPRGQVLQREVVAGPKTFGVVDSKPIQTLPQATAIAQVLYAGSELSLPTSRVLGSIPRGRVGAQPSGREPGVLVRPQSALVLLASSRKPIQSPTGITLLGSLVNAQVSRERVRDDDGRGLPAWGRPPAGVAVAPFNSFYPVSRRGARGS